MDKENQYCRPRFLWLHLPHLVNGTLGSVKRGCILAVPGDEELELIITSVYHSLRASRRRRTIQILKEDRMHQLTTRELARKITSLEEAVPERRATGEPYRNVYNALSQTHLPALADAKIIIYDSNRQVVSPGLFFDLAALLLDTNHDTVELFRVLIDDTSTEGWQ